ncbi:MAG TPA: BrnA antitoxin family protein [Burkholderiaceae bacterium]|nr:BrnA antitoxin family protein [Burkholderiaceae bacterium]
MKSDATRKKLPATPAEWEAAIAAAPGRDRALTKGEEARLANAVVVKGGGYAVVHAALAHKRKRGERGPQQAPTKQLVSVRYSPEVLKYFKATGEGWQSRMDGVLREYVARQSRRA